MLETLSMYAIMFVVLILSYIGIHMSFEKDAKKHIPLIWERGGLLHKLFYPESQPFDKSKTTYRDGDNT